MINNHCQNRCRDLLQGEYVIVREKNGNQFILTKKGWSESFDGAYVHDHRIMIAAQALVVHDKELKLYLACNSCNKKTHVVYFDIDRAIYQEIRWANN